MVDLVGLRDRFRGAIVGTAIGDGLGAPFEGGGRPAPEVVARWAGADVGLRWTDDTAMTISVAESLTAVGGFDGEDLARRFLARHDADPGRGYGSGPPRIFAALRAGAPWHAPAAELFGGQGSYGNGAAMRAAPVGLFCHGDLAAAAALARDTARVTHAHELAQVGAAIQACGVGWLTAADPMLGAWTPADLLRALRPVASAWQYTAALDVVAELSRCETADDEALAAQVEARIGTGVAATQAVPAALHALLRHPDDFAGAVCYAVSLGGDTDTIAAMTGALSGALHGYGAIPNRWLSRLEAHADLIRLADDLLLAAVA